MRAHLKFGREDSDKFRIKEKSQKEYNISICFLGNFGG